MRKETFFPYWTDLQRVIAVAQSQTASNFKLTLVSIEAYSIYGFLLTFNVQSSAPSAMAPRIARGWTRAHAVDDEGNPYSSHLITIKGVSHRQLFSGRAVTACMPRLADEARALVITVGPIEWDLVEGDASEPASEVSPGPWRFDVAL